jgi:hypothetical protein
MFALLIAGLRVVSAFGEVGAVEGVERVSPRCEAVREEVRDMVCTIRSFTCSRSFSRRSLIAASLERVSTGL